MAAAVLIPTVSWAQRKDLIYLTVKVPELSNPEIKVRMDSLSVSYVNGSGKIYQLNMSFFKPVDPSRCKQTRKGNFVEFTIMKADCEAAYWSRLVVDTAKQHWLRVDFNKWKDESGSESEEEEEEVEEDVEAELTEGMEKLKCDDEPLKPIGRPGAASWAVGLSPSQQQEWMVDCYRLRVDDEYAWGGEIRDCSLYDTDCSAADLVQDFLLFCRLAKEQEVLPAVWCWAGLLTVAARLLPYAFEKSDAKEKYGSENVFNAAMGGRSLRFTGEVIYGTGIKSGEISPLHSRLEEELMHKKRTPAMVHNMGGKKEWNILEREVARQLKSVRY